MREYNVRLTGELCVSVLADDEKEAVDHALYVLEDIDSIGAFEVQHVETEVA